MSVANIVQPNSLIKAEGLSEQLGISVSSIYRRRSLGEPLPPAVKLGKGSLRWRQRDIDAWLEEHLEAE
ncbi:helix-turn-helix transcriptional regulator [Leucobacter chromiiresistens]